MFWVEPEAATADVLRLIATADTNAYGRHELKSYNIWLGATIGPRRSEDQFSLVVIAIVDDFNFQPSSSSYWVWRWPNPVPLVTANPRTEDLEDIADRIQLALSRELGI